MNYVTYLMPMTDEALIDAGIASDEVIERDQQRRLAALARWRALPWYVRLYRQLFYGRWHELQGRLRHASRALRGMECER